MYRHKPSTFRIIRVLQHKDNMKIKRYKNGSVIVSQGIGLELLQNEEEEAIELPDHKHDMKQLFAQSRNKDFMKKVKELKEQEKIDGRQNTP